MNLRVGGRQKNIKVSRSRICCTGCGCLCDDIEIQTENNSIKRIENACLKGSSLIYASQDERQRVPCLVEGAAVSLEEALSRTAQLLSKARSPLIFGLDNSTLEAQGVGIELAKRLKCVIDDNSSFCHGTLVRSILTGTLPACSLSEVDDADLLLYWGANPHHSHPRHLSKFSFYAHEKYHPVAPRPQITLASIDVRDSDTASVCHPFFNLLPKGDKDFIAAAIEGMKGSPIREDAGKFLQLLRRSKFCIIFAGLGLTYSLDDDFSLFIEMVTQLSQWLRIAVIPMVGHSNMRGFNQSLYQATGQVNKVSFADGISHGQQFSFLEQVKNQSTDCLLIIGANPFSNLPHSVVKDLMSIPLITLDPFYTATSRASQIVLGTAYSGLETGGTALRMDGTKVSLIREKDSHKPSDEQILERLLERVGK